MPREKQIDIPDTLKRSDEHAQAIYRETLQSAYESYDGDEERAHRVAFAAVKHQYKKSGDRWVKKARKGPSDPQAARGPNSDPPARSTASRTAGGAVASMDRSRDELYERARELDISGRSRMNKEELAIAVHEASAQ